MPHVTESFALAEVASGVARILAEVVLGGPSDRILEILDVGRFAENRLVPEPQLV